MPLLDHFHEPLTRRLQWISFHYAWCAALSADLNRRLPRGFSARPNAVFGIEIDVAAVDDPAGGGAAVTDWSPGPPAATLPLAVGADHVEVLVENRFADTPLAAAIELVSPANKDRPATREAFVGKCLDYLNHGAGVLVVDVVTSRRANLHDDLLARIGRPEPAWGADLYAAAFRPTGGGPPSDRGVRVHGAGFAQVWRAELTLGKPLPEMPLWLLNGPCIPVPLEAVYERALTDLGLSSPTPPNGTA